MRQIGARQEADVLAALVLVESFAVVHGLETLFQSQQMPLVLKLSLNHKNLLGNVKTKMLPKLRA